MRTLIHFAIAALLALPVQAASPTREDTITWYDVELIVFRNLDTRSSETWPPDAGVPDVADARPLFPPAEPLLEEEQQDAAVPASIAPTDYPQAPTPYEPLDEAAYQLSGVYGSLRRSSKYEPLLHLAWTQPPLEREQAPKLRLTLPGALDEKDEVIEQLPAGDEPLLGREGDEDAPEAPALELLPEFLAEEADRVELARPLDGTVQLSVSRYLHLDLDLVYLPDDLNTTVLDTPAATREWTEAEKLEREQRRRDIIEALARGDISVEEAEILALEPEEQVFQGFRLDQYRRLRSRELHYFDHPAFGVIVMVTPREVSARTLQLENRNATQ